jgi:hypothetical protein
MPFPSGRPCISSDSCAVVVDPRVWDIAEDYVSNFPGRQLLELGDLTAKDYDSLFVVAQPDVFDRHMLDHLSSSKRKGVIGVATARRNTELRKFLTLQLHHQDESGRVRESLLLDELHNCALFINPTSQTYRIGPYPTSDIRTRLVQGSDVLAMHVHGEGAHGNLRSTVLCGHSQRPDPDDFCTDKRCKRSSHTHGEFLPFYSVRAQTILLLSCSGFSVRGAHYPSSNSAVLSMVGGGLVRHIVCNDRTVPMTASEVRLAFLSAVDNGAVNAVNLLNEMTMPRIKVKPWYVVGDPVAYSKRITSNFVRHVAITDSAEGRIPGVLRVSNTDGAVAKLVRTVAIENLTCSAVPELSDVTNKILELKEKVAQAVIHSRAIDCIATAWTEFDTCGDKSAKVREFLTSIASIRSVLIKVKQRIDLIERNGCITSTDDWWPSRIGRLLGSFSHCVAKFLLDILDFPIDVTIADLGSFDALVWTGYCERCASDISRCEGRMWSLENIPMTLESCLTCGTRRVIVGRDPKPTISAMSIWSGVGYPGDFYPRDSSVLCLSMMDKATGRTLIHCGPVNRPILSDDSAVKVKPSADIHTVRILSVSPYGFSIDRRRVVTPPNNSATPPSVIDTR